MRKRVKRWLWYSLSLALAVGILAVLLGRQKWADFSKTLGGVDWRWLGGVVATAGVYWLVRTARWRWMAALEGRRLGWTTAWVSMLAGLGVGLITPLRGGEVVRPMFVPRGRRMRLAGQVVLERMFDLSAVLTLCLLGVFYMVFAGGVKLSGAAALPAWALLACPLLLAAAVGAPLVVHYRPARLWRVFRRLLPGKARELAEVRLNRRQFAIFLGTSIFAEAVNILGVYFCLRAYGRIDLLTACALAPVVMLHNILPATPGGFGIRESVAVAVFGAMDLPGLGEAAVLAAYLTNPMIVLVIPGAAGVAAAWVAGVARQVKAEAAS